VVVTVLEMLIATVIWASDKPCVGVLNQGGCQPAPWNGQLMDTWNTPGYYGGWTNGPVQCDPFTTQCRGWAQP